MYCNKCGDPIEPNEFYCNKCGNYLGNINSSKSLQQPLNNTQPNLNNNSTNKTRNDIIIGVVTGIGAICLIIMIVGLVNSFSIKYNYENNSPENPGEIVKPSDSSSTTKKRKYGTAIVYDNKYYDVTINNKMDVYKLIENDSISQKNHCPSKIKVIEDDIINNYGITAVNLCELDVDFAQEVENVIKKIYYKYPKIRGYITNLSLVNSSLSDDYIAAFMPAFHFASSKSASTYPWAIKTQILLNSSYFLNIDRLQATVIDSSKSGHFPPNSTIYSPVAHEFGHYLSFIAMMNKYNTNSVLIVDENNEEVFSEIYSDFVENNFSYQLINEAYENYKRDTNSTIGFDEWRGTISKYALAKNNNGDYIYDETIAESFHDVYLNGDNSKDASKYIVKVLNSKLGN